MPRTIAQLQAELEDAIERDKTRNDQIANGEKEYSDCFLSDWASQLNISKLQRAIWIAENGGEDWFTELLTLDDKPTYAKLCKTQYGYAWRLPNGVWVGRSQSISPETQEKYLAKKGFKEEQVLHLAKAVIKGEGSACYVGSRKVYTKDCQCGYCRDVANYYQIENDDD
ncbi:MAG: hypothetical protein HXX08_11550 [Chloroflexi bacterium]|uniref:Uncharacterized protein n=1 Tax=Candidatus Chlorohelix allophototropha TaxID=3003348 RepID=A0A8T7M3N7_9CHLR|nr:hypothetical protein [Chloroflexota bacterium]WJW65874.1 hypothetical protein OZ401_001653 [Chloroflexota bacterium L227-S17]